MRFPPEITAYYCALNRLFTLLENAPGFKRLSPPRQEGSEVTERVVRPVDHVLAHDVDLFLRHRYRLADRARDPLPSSSSTPSPGWPRTGASYSSTTCPSPRRPLERAPRYTRSSGVRASRKP